MGVWDGILDAANPLQPYFALGGLLNQATGGKTGSYSFAETARGQAAPSTYSTTVHALSVYDAGEDTSDGVLGGLQLPVVNRHGKRLAKEVVEEVTDFAWDAIPTWLKVAGGGALGLVAFIGLRKK